MRRARRRASADSRSRAPNGEWFGVALEHLFQGSALNAVDAKGRVSIPAFLRGVLERLLEKEETSPDAQHEYQQRNLMAFAATEEVPYDSSGRILFPLMMRRKGQIGELALFLGTGETFQIWNPDLLLKDPRIPEDLKDIARYRLEERGQS